LSQHVAHETGVEDASVKLIPWSGYGDRNVLFALINQEQPDAIFHFTDPRYWTWLYALEHELKTTYNIPLVYYSIWDDLPYPMWNAPFYGSCDLIMGISKQSDNIHREVLKQNGFGVVDYDEHDSAPLDLKWNEIITGYVPHGLNHTKFKPIPKDDELYKKMHDQFKKENGIEFMVFWNNRNIRRKQPGDVILAFKTFVDSLPEDQKNKVGLVMHTQPVDDNGTDLIAVRDVVAPDCKIIFSDQKLTSEELNAFTPIINNVTGGLQDQCGFEDENGEWIRFNGEFATNHTGKYKLHGVWVKPVFPSNRSLQGSPQTPYIFDDRVKFEDVADAIMYWYNIPETLRDEMGLVGRTWALANGLTAEQMGNKMIHMIDYLFDVNKESRPTYTFNSIEDTKYENIGIVK